MSTINLSNLKIIDQFSEPYPLIIYSDLLDVSQLDSLQESLSKDETIYDKIVMGNRKTIIKGTKNFEKLLKKNNTANEVNNFFENKSVFDFFYNDLEKLNLKNNDYFDFSNKKFKFLKNFTNSNSGYASNRSLSFRLKNRISKIFSKINNDCSIYCDFDFSVASTGYWREPHHDKDERVMNFLFYINNFSEDNGGSFQVFKYKKNPQKYLKQPDLNNLEMIKKIEPKRGYLVTFLSSPNSLHGVELIKQTNQKRYFFYGSYTSLQLIEWKKNIY